MRTTGGKEREKGQQKYLKKCGPKLSKYGERYESTHQKTSTHFKQNKDKQITHRIIKWLKAKNRENLESRRREVTLTYKGSSITLTAGFLLENTEARGQWDGIYKILKEKITEEFYVQQNYSSKI